MAPRRILVVEDSVFALRVTRGLLEAQGHRVASAVSGAEALAALAAGEFDAVLLDLELPDMDGIAVVEALRAKGGATPPLIVVTGHDAAGVRARCLAAGIREILSKPYRAEELAAAIARALGSEIDLSAALKAARGSREILARMLGALVDEAPRLLAALRVALADGDARGAHRAAHTLLGSLRSLEAPRARELCAAVQKDAQRGDLAAATARLPELEAQLRALLPHLERFLK